MKNERGFIIPLLALIAIAVIGGGVYYYTKHHTDSVATVASSTPAVVTTSTTTTTTVTTNSTSGNPSTGATVTTSANVGSYGTYGGANFTEISTQGVMPQRLGWQTYTDTDYSFAFSYPSTWFATGASSLVTVTDGSARIVFQSSNIPSGTTAMMLANQSGAYSGFITTKVNAYEALETTENGNTVYYIVNGSVGYKISVSGAVTSAEAAVIRDILIEFTVTKER